ncbi:MAG: hypothetical protein K9H06_21590, partial [Melioribacteraceae bacterium]|nr:hypothetical protein [Melioribacteraceae bacterium]
YFTVSGTLKDDEGLPLENIKVVIDDVYPADTLLSNGDGYFEKTVREDEGTFYIKPDISVHNFYPRNVSTGYLESDEEYEFIKYNDLVNEWTATSVGVSRRMRDSSIYSIAMNISTDYLLSRREYNVVSDLVNQYDNYNVSITPSTIPPIQSIEITGEGNTYKGIFAVTKPSSRWELLWEVVNIEEATPPTAEDGFGSTNGGADSTYYISNFMMK